MKVVLDTNVLLTIISERSSIHDIFMAFIEEQYTICVTTDILMEYEEVITRHMGISYYSGQCATNHRKRFKRSLH